MKKILLLILFVCCFYGVLTAEENIAVFPFENKAEQDYNVTELAENEMTSLLVNQKRFEVIERKELNKILDEQHLSNSGIVDINQALEIGKIKGIKYGVFGQITNVSYTNKDLALITLQIKIVDMETANVMFSKVYNARPTDEKSNDKATVLSNILKEKFKKDISKDLINTFTIEGSIIDIDGKKVIIDIGQKQGVVRGMEFNVIDVKEKVSSRTKEKINIEKPVAILEVIDVVSNNSSICKFKEGEKLEEGMTVKLVQIDDRYYKAEDVEELIAKQRKIQKGDLIVSVFGGIGNFSIEEIANNGSLSASIYGIQCLAFINYWLGLGIDFHIANVSGEPKNYQTSDFNCSIKNISVSGRINLNNSSFRVYIPFEIGIANYDYKFSHSDYFGEYGEEEKAENALLSSFGIGAETNLTNNLWLGLEGKYNFINCKQQISIQMLLLKLSYRFNKLIKF